MMIEKKIIHTVPAITEEASGVSYYVERLCCSLLTNNIDLCLGSLDKFPSSSMKYQHKVFPITRFSPKRLGHSIAMYQWLRTLAADNTVGLIHNHSLWMMPNVYPLWINKKYQKPVVVSPHGTLTPWAFTHGSKVKYLFWPAIQKPALLATTCFHATAISEYEDIRALGFRQPVAVIPIGVDIPEEKRQKKNKFRTLLFLSRMHPKKGIELLLQAWQHIQNHFSDWQLMIVGPDNAGHRDKMMALATQLALQRVEFRDVMYGEQKWQCYQNADVFVLPSFSENFGIVIAEALASGVPVITTKGTPWERLEKFKAGWWIDNDKDSLIATLEAAMGCSQNQLEAMGMRGRQWMMNEFSWDRIARQVSEMYAWIMSGGNKPDWILVD